MRQERNRNPTHRDRAGVSSGRFGGTVPGAAPGTNRPAVHRRMPIFGKTPPMLTRLLRHSDTGVLPPPPPHHSRTGQGAELPGPQTTLLGSRQPAERHHEESSRFALTMARKPRRRARGSADSAKPPGRESELPTGSDPDPRSGVFPQVFARRRRDTHAIATRRRCDDGLGAHAGGARSDRGEVSRGSSPGPRRPRSASSREASELSAPSRSLLTRRATHTSSKMHRPGRGNVPRKRDHPQCSRASS